MMGVSAQKYFKMFFSAIIEGRRDYARSALPLCYSKNLLPTIIGIK